MSENRLVFVQIGNGLVVAHSPAEWAAWKRGVDMDAARRHSAPLELTEPKEKP